MPFGQESELHGGADVYKPNESGDPVSRGLGTWGEDVGCSQIIFIIIYALTLFSSM